MVCCEASLDMGLGAGGRMRQEIYADPHGLETWEAEPTAVVDVRLVEAHEFAEEFGVPVPPTPIDVATYSAYGLPWFDLYDAGRPAIPGSRRLGGVASVGERAGDPPEKPVPVDPAQIVSLGYLPPA